MRKALLSAALACSISACSAVGPDYISTEPPSPSAFANAVPSPVPAARDASEFWSAFHDPSLSDLVTQALAANNDIRIALAALREARGLRSEVRGGLYPKIDAGAFATYNRLSLAELPRTTNRERTNPDIDLGFDASWEIDLFGGIRRSVEAATAQAKAAEGDLEAMRVSVSAETARTYLELRGLQERLRVAKANLGNQSDTLNIITVRFDSGRGTDFDVSRARGLVETTRATIPALETALAKSFYALAVLTGRTPGSLSGTVMNVKPIPTTPPNFVLDSPALLLRSRPDVMAAERRVAAASASIGVSTAELFPSITLIGAVGVNATNGRDLSKANALRYSVGPTLSWNLIDFGRIRSRIEQADARYDGALAGYEKTVLMALQDAESTLVDINGINERAAAIAAATDAARTAAHLAKLRYDAGATDVLDLLDAERQVLSAEDQLSQVETARVVASVALFKAMAGAWRSDPGTWAVPQQVN